MEKNSTKITEGYEEGADRAMEALEKMATQYEHGSAAAVAYVHGEVVEGMVFGDEEDVVMLLASLLSGSTERMEAVLAKTAELAMHNMERRLADEGLSELLDRPLNSKCATCEKSCPLAGKEGVTMEEMAEAHSDHNLH